MINFPFQRPSYKTVDGKTVLKTYKEGSCNSADLNSLPTDLAGGSKVRIIDPADGAAPGKIFNEDTGEWDDFFFNTGGDSLPSVTEADNGKVLTVQDGKWAAGTIYDFSSYKSITKAIRDGNIDLIPNGTEFVVPHEVFGDIWFVTRMKNAFKVHGNPTKPNLCIQSKYLLSIGGGSTVKNFQYDKPEAFQSVAEEISAGTVCKFTTITYGNWAAGTYHFTASSAIPAGSKLCISGAQNTALTSLTVDVYASAKATSKTVSYAISSGDGDATVDLGTWGTNANHPQRVSYGSNNEAESNLFQFLNADSGNGNMASVFEPKTPYDMMTNDFASIKGFLGGFPADFRECLALCDIPNITNDVYETAPFETNKHYTHTGYFFLPSRKEVYGTEENANETDETQMPYYAEIGTTDADKLLYAKGAYTASTYWLRTPHASNAYDVRVCHAGNGGALNVNNATSSRGAAPLAILA